MNYDPRTPIQRRRHSTIYEIVFVGVMVEVNGENAWVVDVNLCSYIYNESEIKISRNFRSQTIRCNAFCEHDFPRDLHLKKKPRQISRTPKWVNFLENVVVDRLLTRVHVVWNQCYANVKIIKLKLFSMKFKPKNRFYRNVDADYFILSNY